MRPRTGESPRAFPPLPSAPPSEKGEPAAETLRRLRREERHADPGKGRPGRGPPEDPPEPRGQAPLPDLRPQKRPRVHPHLGGGAHLDQPPLEKEPEPLGPLEPGEAGLAEYPSRIVRE